VLYVVALAALLRFVPIWFGLPFGLARPDEEAAIGTAVSIADGDLNPHFFHWPSLTFYLFAALFRAASLVHRLLGLDPMVSPNERYLLARGLVALAGTLTVIVVWAVARRIADDETALVAAFFLAVAPLHVRDSHFAMTDVLMTLFATLSVAILVRALDEPSRGSFTAAGAVGGLAASTKYSAAAVVLAMPAAQWSWIFLLAFALAFVAGTPYALFDFRSFLDGVAFDFTHLAAGHVATDRSPGWLYHLTRSLPAGLTIPLLLAAMAGVVPIVMRRRRAAVVLGAYSIALFTLLGAGRTVFFRYIMPLVPIACVVAAVAVEQASTWLERRWKMSRRMWIAVLTIVVGGTAIVNSVWSDVLLARTDTRVIAGEWLASRVKPEEALYDAGNEYSGISLLGIQGHHWALHTFDAPTNSFTGAEGRLPEWLVLPESPLTIYTSVPDGLRRLARDRYELVRRVDATAADGNHGVYDQADAFFLPLAGFGGVRRPGPTEAIYRRVR
jgi:uncharacterized membrane protein (GlpM family)